MRQNRKVIKIYQKDQSKLDTILKLLLKYIEIKRGQAEAEKERHIEINKND